MKKKKSTYYKVCMTIAVLALLNAINSPNPQACAIFSTICFMTWWVGVMAPDNEKYKS